MKDFSKFIDQPYPFYYKGKKLWQICVVIFLLAFFFNYVIKPFEIDYSELRFDYFWIAIAHSTVPIVLLIFLALLFSQSPIATEDWILKKEIIFISIFLIITGLGQFLIRDLIYNNNENWSLVHLLEEIRNTIFGGLPLALLIISINLNIQFFKNSNKASELTGELASNQTSSRDNELIIETDVKSETFQMQIDQFLFAKAAGNYTELMLLNENQTAQEVKRLKLKDLELLLENFPQILRTHRSYLVNRNYIKSISGNAQGYKLKLKNYTETIPVSRTYLQHFNEHLNLS